MSEPIIIRCRENGPLVLPPNFKIVDHHGNEYALPTDKPLVALCRCGQSKNKPFCDGSHKECGFKDGGVERPARARGVQRSRARSKRINKRARPSAYFVRGSFGAALPKLPASCRENINSQHQIADAVRHHATPQIARPDQEQVEQAQ